MIRPILAIIVSLVRLFFLVIPEIRPTPVRSDKMVKLKMVKLRKTVRAGRKR